LPEKLNKYYAIMSETSFMGCRLFSRQTEEGRGVLRCACGTSNVECYTCSKNFINPEITLLKYSSINSKTSSEAEGCRERVFSLNSQFLGVASFSSLCPGW